MKYVWKDLPKPLNCFTVRNARMVNLNTGKIVSNYSANTKITVVQKCITPNKTYYRTREAAHYYLNYAFEASAFGLPNEKAPSVPSTNTLPPLKNSKPVARTPKPEEKQKDSPKKVSPKGGGERPKVNFIKRLVRRVRGRK